MVTYRFDPSSIAKMRTRLGIKQATMAVQLGVKKNVLSEWETGKAEPSLANLAAIYSIGVEHDHQPNFFTLVKQQQPEARQASTHTTAFVYWDAQNVAPRKSKEPEWREFIDEKVRECIPEASVHSNAFISPNQERAFSQAKRWNINKSRQNQDETIIRQIGKDTKESPESKVVFLVTFDGGYVNVVKEVQERGVTVYLITVLRKVSRRLLKTISGENVIALP